MHLRQVMPVCAFRNEWRVAKCAFHDRVCSDHCVVAGPTEGQNRSGIAVLVLPLACC
ncbi:GSCOCG00003386001-RA-CDS [Cotesia congregata]|nr:GSCOCG00003386001-RA-CDS [Cotesia congregata]